MRALLVVASVLGGLASEAVAENWRDGCPPGRNSGGGTVARRFGAIADSSSLLHPAHAKAGLRLGYLTEQRDVPRRRLLLYRGEVMVPIPQGSLSWLNRDIVTSLSASAVTQLAQDEPDEVSRVDAIGNVHAGIGARWMWITSMDGATQPDSTEVIAAFRKAAAFQITFAGIPAELDKAVFDAIQRQPFDERDFALDELEGPVTSLGGRFEYRMEVVGCHAPFLHIVTWPTVQRRRATYDEASPHLNIVVPVHFTVGAEVGSRTSLMLQYAAVLRGDALDDHEMTYKTDHRIRLALDIAWVRARMRFGFYLDHYPGAPDGFFGGMTLTLLTGYPR